MTTSMIRARLASWRRYRQTFRELEALNDRELADLGLGRRDIRVVARQASRWSPPRRPWSLARGCA